MIILYRSSYLYLKREKNFNIAINITLSNLINNIREEIILFISISILIEVDSIR